MGQAEPGPDRLSRSVSARSVVKCKATPLAANVIPNVRHLANAARASAEESMKTVAPRGHCSDLSVLARHTPLIERIAGPSLEEPTKEAIMHQDQLGHVQAERDVLA